ncbi:MAG: hypothetical protein JW913_04685 [Chitinispirillaceae bacterium]|nr:hypothetical protein [Chitinispirillaceae bacterium]
MCVKYGFVAGTLLSVNLLSCLAVDPPLPQKLEKPVLNFSGMAAVGDPIEGYHEAVHLSWMFTRTENTPVHSYSLLRKFPADSFFDVFLGSQQIPADTTHFYDKLARHPFPVKGFDSISYRLCAVDTFGRTGDTSDECTVVLAPQPQFVNYTTANGCLQWESWIRGGIFSWCTVWHETGRREWTSQRQDAFPQTDQPGRFSACFPDSLQPPFPGRWYYALFVRANDTYSLKIGTIDVE